MTKHIHIYLEPTGARVRTGDADGPKHAPAGSSKGGQFVSGSGGGGSKPATKSAPSARSVEEETNAQVAAEAKKHKLQGLPKAQERRVERQTQSQVAAEQAKHSKPPTSLVHGGKKHTATGKTGKSASGEVTHEYEAVDDQGKRTGARVWRTASGKVIPD